ncbi:MAG: DUF3644 domain-containing protein [Leptospirillum sp.]
MKKESKLLLEKSYDSLLLSIELFNRPQDRGRVCGTLIQLDHSFEMLLKAAIVQRGGKIRDTGARETIGFDKCVRRGLSDSLVKFLNEEQALTLQIINGLRDAAQHHLLDISESHFYLHVQSGVTLFRDLLKSVFDKDPANFLPNRVLPVSTSPFMDLSTLFEFECDNIKSLLGPRRRKQIEVEARLRPLAILDSTIRGEKGQPSSTELRNTRRELLSGKKWPEIFSGVAAVEMTSSGSGPTISLRISKKEGIPIQLVPEGTHGAGVVATKRVNDFDFYNLGAKQLAKKLEISVCKTVAVVDHFKLRSDPECYKEFKSGSMVLKKYSPKSIEKIREYLKYESADAIWAKKYPKKVKP